MKYSCIAVLAACMLVCCVRGGVDATAIVIDEKSTVIDVRTAKEYQEGHLKNSINIPYDEIKDKITGQVKDKKEKIYLYCRSGRRSGIAKNILDDMGYENVINAGAYETLKKQETGKQKE